MLEGQRFKNKRRKITVGTQNAWDKFLKQAVNVAAPFTEMVVAAKCKTPTVGQATRNF